MTATVSREAVTVCVCVCVTVSDQPVSGITPADIEMCQSSVLQQMSTQPLTASVSHRVLGESQFSQSRVYLFILRNTHTQLMTQSRLNKTKQDDLL